MNNSTASAPDGVRPARPQPGKDSHAGPSKVASRSEASVPDAEILELVERFETAFAELASEADEVEPPGTEPDLFPDFSQDIFRRRRKARPSAASRPAYSRCRAATASPCRNTLRSLHGRRPLRQTPQTR
jgi:hypothetical protein